MDYEYNIRNTIRSTTTTAMATATHIATPTLAPAPTSAIPTASPVAPGWISGVLSVAELVWVVDLSSICSSVPSNGEMVAVF